MVITMEPNLRRRDPGGWVFLAGLVATGFTAQPVAYTTVLGNGLGMNTELPFGLQLGAYDFQNIIWGGYIGVGVAISLLLGVLASRSGK